MSFFDKMAKAVSDTVDRGKKEVDQFMRVQKVKGEIVDLLFGEDTSVGTFEPNAWHAELQTFIDAH